MKLTLSKKKALKITTGAPNGEPDPSQTTVKTVYDPRKEKRDQPVKGTTNIAQSGLEQPSGGGTPPIGGKEPPHESEGGRPDRPPGGRGDLNEGNSNGNGSSHGNGNGRLHRNGGPNGNGDPNGGGDPDGNGEPPRRGEEAPRRNRELGGGGGGSDPSDVDGSGDGSSSPSSNATPPRRRRHRSPDLFM